MTKCTPQPDGYAATLCEAMIETAMFYPTARTSGMFRAQIVNIKTGEPKGTRILVKSGEHKVDGIVANICPFCGGGLRDASHD